MEMFVFYSSNYERSCVIESIHQNAAPYTCIRDDPFDSSAALCFIGSRPVGYPLRSTAKSVSNTLHYISTYY